MKMKDLRQQHRRLIILRVLADDSDYRLNHFILQDALDLYGQKVSEDVLRADIHWLEEQGMVGCEEVKSALVVSLTGQGLDVSQGRATVPGVMRPRPGM